MSRYCLTPTAAQALILLEHCAHARFIWNLAVEQQSWWHPGRGNIPGYCEQARQLTEAREEFKWLLMDEMVQQQALRDFYRRGRISSRELSASRHGEKLGVTKDSVSWGNAGRTGTCADSAGTLVKSGYRRSAGYGFVGPAPCRRARSRTG